jgi:hypothetical protein
MLTASEQWLVAGPIGGRRISMATPERRGLTSSRHPVERHQPLATATTPAVADPILCRNAAHDVFPSRINRSDCESFPVRSQCIATYLLRIVRAPLSAKRSLSEGSGLCPATACHAGKGWSFRLRDLWPSRLLRRSTPRRLFLWRVIFAS